MQQILWITLVQMSWTSGYPEATVLLHVKHRISFKQKAFILRPTLKRGKEPVSQCSNRKLTVVPYNTHCYSTESLQLLSKAIEHLKQRTGPNQTIMPHCTKQPLVPDSLLINMPQRSTNMISTTCSTSLHCGSPAVLRMFISCASSPPRSGRILTTANSDLGAIFNRLLQWRTCSTRRSMTKQDLFTQTYVTLRSEAAYAWSIGSWILTSKKGLNSV